MTLSPPPVDEPPPPTTRRRVVRRALWVLGASVLLLFAFFWSTEPRPPATRLFLGSDGLPGWKTFRSTLRPGPQDLHAESFARVDYDLRTNIDGYLLSSGVAFELGITGGRPLGVVAVVQAPEWLTLSLRAHVYGTSSQESYIPVGQMILDRRGEGPRDMVMMLNLHTPADANKVSVSVSVLPPEEGREMPKGWSPSGTFSIRSIALGERVTTTP